MSAEQRKAVGERMRKYWAERRGNRAAASSDGAEKKAVRKGRAKSAGRKGARKMSAAARKRIGEAQPTK